MTERDPVLVVGAGLMGSQIGCEYRAPRAPCRSGTGLSGDSPGSLWVGGEGVATREAVDKVVRSGLARRHRYTGPFETVALGGVGSWTRVAENLFPELSNATRPEGLERSLVYDDETLGAARERRDRGLARELAAEEDR